MKTIKRTNRSLDTKLIHAGEPLPRFAGALVLPIFQSATFEPQGGEDYHDIHYARLSNTPNHEALHDKLAAIETGEAALVTSSGMAAIASSLLTVLSSGDHLLAQNVLYGGTYGLLKHELPAFGIEVGFFDPGEPSAWAAALRPNTKAIYVESISNPLLGVGDLEGVAAFAHDHELVSLIDNTFASPVNFRPLEHGFDLSLHSATKYLNGHSDLVAGAVIGKASWITRIKRRLNHLGASLDPHACFLLHRGLKTLALRVRQQNESALRLALWLESHPAIERVYYPGIETHPDHARARELFDGYGGMISVELKGGVDEAGRLLKRLELGTEAPSLGGVETLVSRPVTMSHLGLSPAEKERLGISDSLVRISVGIEAVEDLIEDFRHALES